MELVNIFIELSSLSCDIFQRLIVIAVSLGIEPYFACYLKLVKNIALTDFVRVELKTERSDSDLLETLVNNVQSCLLLCREKNLLAIRKTVGDYGRNCL